MTKFYGVVGYAFTVETKPGVWTPQFFERPYYGDVIKNSRKLYAGQSTNDNIDISQDISIIADEFAFLHFSEIRYVEYMGAKWKVTYAEPMRPRIKLTVGGLYNAEPNRFTC